MKKVKEILYEKFTDHSDPIKDMDIGALKVYAIKVNLADEEWQTNQGVDIIVARSKKQARETWNTSLKHTYFDNSKPEISEIIEIDINKKGFYHIEDAGVE
jgi:hypothetical protein